MQAFCENKSGLPKKTSFVMIYANQQGVNMTFKEYLKLNKIRLEDFMIASGYSYSALSKLYSGMKCGKGMAYRIEELTKGCVKAKDISKLRGQE